MKTKLHNLRFIVITTCIFLLTFLPNGFTQDAIKNSTFIYQEVSNQTNLTGVQPQILKIDHYNDNSGTAIVRIARENYINSIDDFTKNSCYEQRLLLRVIQGNGNVIEINYEDATEIQDINYCYIVTYTHATNTSDTATYMDRGMVFDWGGNIISHLEFGQSFLHPDTNWYPYETVVNNISPKKGFLRLSAINANITDCYKWSQYEYNGSGKFSLLQNDTIPIAKDVFSYEAIAFATLDGGYALIYANTSIKDWSSNNTLGPDYTGIYAIILYYNQSITTYQSLVLYQSIKQDIIFSNLYCSTDFVSIGYSCIAYAVTNELSTTSTSDNCYVRTRFISSGTVLSLDLLSPSNNGSFTSIRTLPLGGYAAINNASNINFTLNLYNEDANLSSYNFPLKPITVNSKDAFDVLQNNTVLVAQNETTTSWNILLIDLPKLSPYNNNGYGNLQVNKTYPPKNAKDIPLNINMINITFNVNVSCSVSFGNLTIYQKINQTNIFRQFFNSINCTKSNIITLNVLNCTFNDPGGQYYIQMDNGFVLDEVYRESILGIAPNVWIFQTENITSSKRHADKQGDTRGILRLTIPGSQHFQELNDSGKHDFFVILIDNLTFMIPTEKGRLGFDRNYQLDTLNILISLSIHEANDDEKLTAAEIKDNLNQFITNKEFTVISAETVTNFLDETYGFQQA
ncbi:24036_t:CDS:2, partial [Gigaspora margarita]